MAVLIGRAEKTFKRAFGTLKSFTAAAATVGNGARLLVKEHPTTDIAT